VVGRRGSLTERRQCWVLAGTEAAKMGWKPCQTVVRVGYQRDKAGEKHTGTRYQAGLDDEFLLRVMQQS
jgi:hypothetical protein